MLKKEKRLKRKKTAVKRRFINGEKQRPNYFALTVEVLELSARGLLLENSVRVIAFLHSRKASHNEGVAISQEAIGEACGIKSPQTVRRCLDELKEHGLITWEEEFGEHPKGRYYKPIHVYGLKKVPKRGYILIPRDVFLLMHKFTTKKDFVVYLFKLHAQWHEAGVSWNSYNDICDRIGCKKKNQRSRVMKCIKTLTNLGLSVKTKRQASTEKGKLKYIDNIYRVIGVVGCTGREIRRFLLDIVVKNGVGYKIEYSVLNKEVRQVKTDLKIQVPRTEKSQFDIEHMIVADLDAVRSRRRDKFCFGRRRHGCENCCHRFCLDF
jgi:predicted transcriptional regulator